MLGDGPPPADPDVAAADEIGRSEARLDLLPALRALPARQRAVIAMRYYLDMSEEQTAVAMRCGTGTVKSQAHKAMRKPEAVLGPRPDRPVSERPA